MNAENESIILEHLSVIDKSLSQVFPNKIDKKFCIKQTGIQGDYDHLSINNALKPLKYLLNLIGKKWRSLALTLTAEILGVPKDCSANFAGLVELTHNGSLIIDDIEDGSNLRRGKPSAHVVYGLDMSINAGNYAYFMATTIIEEWEGPLNLKFNIFRSWAESLRTLHLGQALDIAWHQEKSPWPTSSQYLMMCKMKTGCLSQLAGNIASILAQLSHERQSKLANTWQMVGMGFQILDDVKNLSSGVRGKVFADDLIEGKKSLPFILAVEYNEDLKEEFLEYFLKIKNLEGEQRQNMMQSVLKILEDMDVLDQAKNKGLQILASARKMFKNFFPASKTVDVLDTFLENLIQSMV